MEIDIKQRKVFLGRKYIILIEGHQTHLAKRLFFKWLPQIRLYKAGEAVEIMRMKKGFAQLKPEYFIAGKGLNELEFRTVSFWKNAYQCHFGSDTYDIYGNMGRKYSVYKNKKQIAWWDKNEITWFAGNEYNIIADRDSDVELIISFCLIVDDLSYDGGGNIVTIDHGTIGTPAREFNPDWIPK